MGNSSYVYTLIVALFFVSLVEGFAPASSIVKVPLVASRSLYLYLAAAGPDGRVLVPPPPGGANSTDDRFLLPPPQGEMTAEVLLEEEVRTNDDELLPESLGSKVVDDANPVHLSEYLEKLEMKINAEEIPNEVSQSNANPSKEHESGLEEEAIESDAHDASGALEIKEAKASIGGIVLGKSEDPMPSITVEAAAEAGTLFVSSLETKRSEMKARLPTAKSMPPTVEVISSEHESFVESEAIKLEALDAFGPRDTVLEIEEEKTNTDGKDLAKSDEPKPSINIKAATEAGDFFVSSLETRRSEMESRSTTAKSMSPTVEHQASSGGSEVPMADLEQMLSAVPEFEETDEDISKSAEQVRFKKEKKTSYWDTVSPTEISTALIKAFIPDKGIRELKEANDMETLAFAASRFAWGIVKGGSAAFLGFRAVANKKAPDDAVRAVADSTQSFVSSMTAFAALGWKSGERARELIVKMKFEAAEAAEQTRLVEEEREADRLAGAVRLKAESNTEKTTFEEVSKIEINAEEKEIEKQAQGLPHYANNESSQTKSVALEDAVH